VTGAEHYAEAERLLTEVEMVEETGDDATDVAVVTALQAQAQVHASLAVAAATFEGAFVRDFTAPIRLRAGRRPAGLRVRRMIPLARYALRLPVRMAQAALAVPVLDALEALSFTRAAAFMEAQAASAYLLRTEH
jgi:hypothetical protein